jgi:mitochondrial enoyl-[acyl-carrier protein] reductase / trans-2-enoyl-CoA reductase
MSVPPAPARSSSTYSPFRSTRPICCSAAADQSPVSLPATPGGECGGRVAAVGSGITDLRPGDLVTHLQRENWVQRRRIAAADAIPLPAGLDLMEAAMLRINPATALCLLEDHVGLRLGDWVIQNAANSAVGRHLAALAKGRGVHTIAVVNRSDVAAELQALGADAVLQDGPDLAERAAAAAGGAPIRLGIDAIGGEAGRRIGDCLADGGVVVSYGALSGNDPMLSRAALMRGVGVTGFGLSYGLARRTRTQVRELYADLAAKIRDGVLHAPVDATYGIGRLPDRAPSVAVFFYSRNRDSKHPNRHLAGYAGILQADAYGGFKGLYDAKRSPRPITEPACWATGAANSLSWPILPSCPRQKYGAPLALEAVRQIDAIFAIEREINGLPGEQRLAVRTTKRLRSASFLARRIASASSSARPNCKSNRFRNRLLTDAGRSASTAVLRRGRCSKI